MDSALDDRTEADKLLQFAQQLVDTMLKRERMPIYEEMERLLAIAKERD